MTEEQKQALIEDCKASISRIEKSLPHWQESTYTLPYLESELARQKIALAALTAQPVKQPGTKCIGWVKETIQEHDEKWCDAIRAAGYEVQE